MSRHEARRNSRRRSSGGRRRRRGDAGERRRRRRGGPRRRHAERQWGRRRGEGIASSARRDLRVLLVDALVDDGAHRRRRGTRMHGARLQQEGVAGGEQAGGEQQRSHVCVGRSAERARRKGPRSRIDPRGNNKRTERDILLRYFEGNHAVTLGKSEAHALPTLYPLTRTHLVPDPDPNPTRYRTCP